MRSPRAKGSLLSIIVHLAIALVAVLLPETDWWKAREAARQAELERIQAAVVEKQRDQPRFVFVQPQVELAPRNPSAAGSAAVGPAIGRP